MLVNTGPINLSLGEVPDVCEIRLCEYGPLKLRPAKVGALPLPGHDLGNKAHLVIAVAERGGKTTRASRHASAHTRRAWGACTAWYTEEEERPALSGPSLWSGAGV